MKLEINQKIQSELDTSYVPAFLWNEAFRAKVKEQGGVPFKMALVQPNGTGFTLEENILENSPELNRQFAERFLKAMLWMVGGNKVYLACDTDLLITSKKPILLAESANLIMNSLVKKFTIANWSSFIVQLMKFQNAVVVHSLWAGTQMVAALVLT